jgi:hypothetical protein
MYAYPQVMQTFMHPFRILFFRDVSLLGRFEVFKPARQRNINPVESPNFAVAVFLI